MATIAEKDWIWQGRAGHFCGSLDCRFHLATRVGDHLISTVGDYHPRGSKEPQQVGLDRLFETMVFCADGALKCGCAEMTGWDEVDADGYNTASDAQAGHMAMCRKYASLDEETAR